MSSSSPSSSSDVLKYPSILNIWLQKLQEELGESEFPNELARRARDEVVARLREEEIKARSHAQIVARLLMSLESASVAEE